MNKNNVTNRLYLLWRQLNIRLTLKETTRQNCKCKSK